MEMRVELELLETMTRIRSFENRVMEFFADGKIPGFVHLYLGEEAVAAGVCKNLRDSDVIVSNHRGHGHCIAKGANMKKMMAEIFGRSSGFCKGKGGSMHIADVGIGILGANGIVGAGLPIATGAAFSFLYRGTDRVAVCFFGDGASDQGTFHESLNFASIWKLPVLYVCENNLYAESIPTKEHNNIAHISDRKHGYGIKGTTIDGNDVMKVYNTSKEIVEELREGAGPFLLECETYRWRGHFEGEPQTYRPKEVVASWKKRDPIKTFQDKLLSGKMVTQEAIQELEKKAKEEVDAAVAFAEGSPFPAPESALADVYA
jgi:TPP-dependent pyruvate/acetoin dehydrogenase alpha subunit